MDRGKHDEVMDEGVKHSRHGETHPKRCHQLLSLQSSIVILLDFWSFFFICKNPSINLCSSYGCTGAGYKG